MKYQELTFQQIPRAIVRQWKWILMLTALFLAIGAGAGFVFSSQASAEASGTVEEFQSKAFQPKKIELSYYNDFYSYLVTQQSYLFTYLDTVRVDSTITAEQRDELDDFIKEINQYNEDILQEIAAELSKPYSLYMPNTLRDDAINEYTRLLETTQQELVKSEYANQLIQSIGGLNTTDAAINETYAALLNGAAQYGQLQLNLADYEQKLDLLNNNYDEVQHESQALDKMLREAQDTLRVLVQNANALLKEIAAENHIDLTINSTEEAMEVFIDHTHRMATQEEAFSAFVVIFLLIGFCTGCYVALCKEFKNQEKAHDQQK